MCTEHRLNWLHKTNATRYKVTDGCHYNNSECLQIPLSQIETNMTKINRETLGSDDTIVQKDLTDNYRTFYLHSAEYTFFSSVHGVFSKIDYMSGHIANLNKYIEIISCILLDYNKIKIIKKHIHRDQTIMY